MACQLFWKYGNGCSEVEDEQWNSLVKIVRRFIKHNLVLDHYHHEKIDPLISNSCIWFEEDINHGAQFRMNRYARNFIDQAGYWGLKGYWGRKGCGWKNECKCGCGHGYEEINYSTTNSSLWKIIHFVMEASRRIFGDKFVYKMETCRDILYDQDSNSIEDKIYYTYANDDMYNEMEERKKTKKRKYDEYHKTRRVTFEGSQYDRISKVTSKDLKSDYIMLKPI